MTLEMIIIKSLLYTWEHFKVKVKSGGLDIISLKKNKKIVLLDD